MGYDVVARRPRCGQRPTVGRTLDQDLINNVMRLFQQYHKINLVHFPALYQAHYDEIFDAALLGFDNGLVGFFTETDIVDLININTNPLAILKPHLRVAGAQKSDEPKDYLSIIRQQLRRRKDPLLNPNNLELWQNFSHLLSMVDKIIIPMSPLEARLSFNKVVFCQHIENIRAALRNRTNGIKLTEINTLVKIDKRTFNSTSIANVVADYPELFFWTDSINFEGEPIIFDGVDTTHQDLSGKSIQGSISNCIVYRLIISGLYQKTLLLIKSTGAEGLKLAVWFSAINQNFKDAPQQYENDLLEISRPLLFLSLASQNLVILKSGPECKNDLRLHLPTERIDFKILMDQLKRDNDRFADPIPKEKLDTINKLLYQETLRGCIRVSSNSNSDSTDSS